MPHNINRKPLYIILCNYAIFRFLGIPVFFCKIKMYKVKNLIETNVSLLKHALTTILIFK